MKKDTLFAIAFILFTVTLTTGCFRKSNKESLHAFALFNIGLLQQNSNVEMKNDALLRQFENQLVTNPKNESIKQAHDQAMVVAKMSKEVNDYIVQLKVDLIKYSDNIDEAKARERESNPFLVKNKGNYDRPTMFLGTNAPPGNQGKAHELKIKLVDYRTFLLANVKDAQKQDMGNNLGVLDVKDNESKEEFAATWEIFHFYHLPQSAALAELTRWQLIVRQAENDLLQYLLNQV
jgi:hypothetical protein